MFLILCLAFIVGFLIAASSFRTMLFEREYVLFSWLWCITSGLIVVLFELVVYHYA